MSVQSTRSPAMKRTEAMPRSSVAAADSVGLPLRNAPAAGWVNDDGRRRVLAARADHDAARLADRLVASPSLAIASSTYLAAGRSSVSTAIE